jgi:hypothetical protein
MAIYNQFACLNTPIIMRFDPQTCIIALADNQKCVPGPGLNLCSPGRKCCNAPNGINFTLELENVPTV